MFWQLNFAYIVDAIPRTCWWKYEIISNHVIHRKALFHICPTDELRKGLPTIIVEIVEKKLENEYLESTTKTLPEDETDKDDITEQPKLDKTKVDPLVLPESWETMDVNGVSKRFINMQWPWYVESYT